jgi:hypothetical protein
MEKTVLPREEYLQLQTKEALGRLNMYYTYLELGREPTPSEAVMHFIVCGGAQDFSEHFAIADAVEEAERMN